MNVVFITMGRIRKINTRGIYTDLMRKFRDEGHDVYIVTPLERREGLKTAMNDVDGVHILTVRTLNLFNTNIVEKGLATMFLEWQLKRAVKQYLSNLNFDIILYSTPPITFTGVVRFLKRKNPQAVSYLLLKDIFPQNAVDLQMFSAKGLLYKFFRKKEKSLYKISDRIGCMSPANINYLLSENSEINKDRVEIAPNSITLLENYKSIDYKSIRLKYKLPLDKLVFIYGGNLGKPQGVPYIVKCLEQNKNRDDCHFLIVGGGTSFHLVKEWFDRERPKNVSVFNTVPKEEYDYLIKSCDVGLIFLDHRFLIPNYPSRLLPYLENKMPILAATDIHSDIGTIAEKNGYGYWCESVNPKEFTKLIDRFVENRDRIKFMGEQGYKYLLNNYQTKYTYSAIISHVLNK